MNRSTASIRLYAHSNESKSSANVKIGGRRLKKNKLAFETEAVEVKAFEPRELKISKMPHSFTIPT